MQLMIHFQIMFILCPSCRCLQFRFAASWLGIVASSLERSRGCCQTNVDLVGFEQASALALSFASDPASCYTSAAF